MVAKELWSDPTFVAQAAERNGWALKFAPEFQMDYSIVLRAVKQTWRALKFACQELQGNSDIAFEALRQDKRALQYVRPKLMSDRDFLLRLVQNGLFFIHLGTGSI